ncbi:MAG: hypothetical protein JW808_09765 [Victivallales bacterium]|nr:hypothetical protein [Victivallales bacterium]
MEHKVRIGKVADQDGFRREDIRRMSPDERVSMLLLMQGSFYRWAENPGIKRTAAVRRLNHRDIPK